MHNRHVVEDFKARAGYVCGHVAEVPEGGLVVYSAHGISPTCRQESRSRRLIEVDATCPLVTKVHLEVLQVCQDGYQIIFIGHAEHDEAIGPSANRPDSISVVESAEEAATLRVRDPAPAGVRTQTTLSIY